MQQQQQQQQQRKATMRSKRDSSGTRGAAGGSVATTTTTALTSSTIVSDELPTAATSQLSNVKHEGSDTDPCVDEQRQRTFEVNAKLCRLVRRNPWLYNRKHANYAKKNVLDKTWLKIAKDCNDTVASCKERWRNIRAAFARSVNIYKTTGGPNRVKQYYLHKELSFLLKPMLENRHKLQNKIVPDAEPKEELIESPAAASLNGEEPQQAADELAASCAELQPTNTSQRMSPEKTDVNGNHTEFNKTLPSSDMLPELPYKYLENNNLCDVSLASSNAVSPTATPTLSTSTLATEPLLSVKRQPLDRNNPNEQLVCNDVQRQSLMRVNSCCINNAIDADVKFLEALLPDLRSMNSRQKIVFKRKIYQTLEEVFDNNDDFPSSSKRTLNNFGGGTSTMCEVNSYDAHAPTQPPPSALQPMTVIMPQGNASATGMEPLLPIIVKNEPDDVDIS